MGIDWRTITKVTVSPIPVMLRRVVDWLSKDPIGISGGLNQYMAFANNPVMFVDPLGLESWWDKRRREKMEKDVDKVKQSKWKSKSRKIDDLIDIYEKYKDLEGAVRYIKDAADIVDNPSLEQWGVFATETLDQLPTHKTTTEIMKRNKAFRDMYDEAEKQRNKCREE